MPLELTESQQQALREQIDPVELIDPHTQRRYILIAADQYDRMCGTMDNALDYAPPPDISPATLKAQQAFWKALPALLQSKKQLGKWAAFHGDTLLGIAAKEIDLMREIVRQNIPSDAFYIGRIEARNTPPWGTFEYESSQFDGDDE